MKNKWITTSCAIGSLFLATGLITACGTGSSGYTTYQTGQANSTSGSSTQASSAPSPSDGASWLAVDKNNKTATLKLVASENGDNNGFNFNGYSNGAMEITIPVNWTVNVEFQNNSTDMMHSAMIVPFEQRSMDGDFTLAFPNASTPNPEQGTMNGATPQMFSFVANKAGTYAIICAVPGHSTSGFWDTLDVSASATVPIAKVTTASATDTGAGW